MPKIGGSELSLHHLAKGFQERGHSPIVLAPAVKGDLSRWHIDYPVHRYSRARPIFLVLEKLRSHFDILYVDGLYPGGYYAAKLRKFLHAPIVVSCPGGDIQTIPEIGHGKRLDPIIDQKVRWTVRHVDAMFAIVPSFRKKLESIGAPPEQVFDVPHGSDPDRFRDTQSIRSLFQVPEDHKILVLIGRNHEKKGYPDFLRAMTEIIQRYPKFRAIIVGKGTERLQPLADELGITEHVILSPPFTWDDYPRLLVESDIYITPSMGEGFSLALADAMTAGIPQVACDVEGCRDVVKHNETGFIVPKRDAAAMADAVVSLMENDELRRQFSDGSRKAAREFDWNVIVDRHLDIYERLISDYRKGK